MDGSKTAWLYDTSWGIVGIAESEGAIVNVFFGDTVRPSGYSEEETPLLREAADQLCSYLKGERRQFDLPLRASGTPFQRACWAALLTIPYGEQRSYKWLAEQVGRPRATQAVGQANRRNPISIFIPCHRVVGANGSLTGYAGGLPMKERLLALESAGQP